MKIAFWGLYKSFDYYHIGGTDSLTRRLGVELVKRGHGVAFVHFLAPKDKWENTPEGIKLNYYMSFKRALQFLDGNFDQVFTIYVPPFFRLKWLRFRTKKNNMKFHLFLLGWPEQWLGRQLGLFEPMIAPYNGTLYCVSPRLKRYVSRFAERVSLLMPPVPANYFLDTEGKPLHNSLRITYMGRIDPGKGLRTVIDFFRFLKKKAPKIETCICGYPWGHNPTTTKIHKELLSQKEIAYEPADFTNYSYNVETTVRNILRETDVLFLPYERLSSTIDMPLVLLEGMAHLCAVITRPLGSIPEIYGTNECMLSNVSNHQACFHILQVLQPQLINERMRLLTQCRKMRFETKQVVTDLGF